MWEVIVFLSFVSCALGAAASVVLYLFAPDAVRKSNLNVARQGDGEIARRVVWLLPIIVVLLEFWQMTGW